MPLPVPGRVVEMLRRSTVEVLSGSSRVSGTGTGTVVTEGQVVTNAHVVRGTSVTVASWEGDGLPATVLRHRRTTGFSTVGRSGIASASFAARRFG